MRTPDDHEERRRLEQAYAAMTDGELLSLASDPASLTENAWEALQDEMDHRHLEFSHAEPSEPQSEINLRELVVIRQFRDLPEALLAKGSLESSGIECFLRDDNLVRLDWFISNFIGGIKLCVRPEDSQTASTLLDEPILENFYVQGVGLYEQPKCPTCQSLDVNFQEPAPAAYVSAYLNVPMPFHRRAWHCRDCNAEWEDNGVAEADSP